ncbi:MAG: hypothetical protein M3076_16275 [Actinomycetota bacterium]|nr:hypothetical protein [Actinomycetota bacterium]
MLTRAPIAAFAQDVRAQRQRRHENLRILDRAAQFQRAFRIGECSKNVVATDPDLRAGGVATRGDAVGQARLDLGEELVS